MSLLHIASRTTVSEQDFAAANLSDASLVLIEATTTVENFSIELTIGASWSNRYGQTDNAMFEIPDSGIMIASGRSIVVEVAEMLTVPHNVYGLIVPTGSLFLDRGIIIAAAKIEPSFNDRLKLRLVNVSGAKRTLQRGQKIASAVFFATDKTMFHNEVRKSVVIATQPPAPWTRFATWASANKPQLVTWGLTLTAIVVSALALVVSALALQTKATAAVSTPGNRQAVVR